MNQLNQDYLVAAEAVPRETLDRTRTREDESPRVCVLAYLIPPHYGGAGRQATRYAAYLASLGEPVELLTCIPNPEPVPGVEITRFPMPDWYDLKGGSGIVSALRRRLYNPIIVRRLRQYFLDKKIQVVHCVAAKWFSLLAVEAARQAGVPSILETSLLGKDDAEAVGQRTFGRLQLTLFKRADVVVNTSPSLEAACLRAGVEKDRCELIV
ncbi:MAG: glycosyltransferase, partial [Pseudomonadota bacterium]